MSSQAETGHQARVCIYIRSRLMRMEMYGQVSLDVQVSIITSIEQQLFGWGEAGTTRP